MSNYSADCISSIPLYTTPGLLPLSTIATCQNAAQTPFCWPPNGTRICVPTDDIPFYWPTSYYDPSSKVAVDYDLTSNLILLRNNTGNTTQDMTSYMYDVKASSIGQVNERILKFYMVERMFTQGVDPLNLKTHDGPTIVMVKTAAFTTSTRSAASATSTARPYSSSKSSSDGGHGISAGAVAGTVIGGLFALLVIGFWIRVCCGCCGRGAAAGGVKPAKRTIDEQERKRIADQGMELMEGGGVRSDNVMVDVEALKRTRREDEALMGTRREEEEASRLAEWRTTLVPPKYVP